MPPITIELGRDEQRDPDDRKKILETGNINLAVEPLEGESFRGWWHKNQLRPTTLQQDSPMPEYMPGYKITLDVTKRTVRVFDPLYKTEEGEKVAQEIKDRTGKTVNFRRPIVKSDLTKGELWKWAKWMFRACRDGVAKKQEGEWPKNLAGRLEQERQWYDEANPETGERHWEAEPELAGVGA